MTAYQRALMAKARKFTRADRAIPVDLAFELAEAGIDPDTIN